LQTQKRFGNSHREISRLIKLKQELCSFSAFKVHPGHGKRAIRSDGKALVFINGKTEHSHYLKRNPRKINWTILYRRKHKKGLVEEAQKRRTKRVTKLNRAIAGASMTEILALRNQKPEFRKAQREQAVRAAKEANRAKDAEKKAKKTTEAKKQASAAQKQKVAKPVTKAAPRVGGKR